MRLWRVDLRITGAAHCEATAKAPARATEELLVSNNAKWVFKLLAIRTTNLGSNFTIIS